MYRGLYFKIILILVVFILIVMSVVGAVLISSVLKFYNDDFANCMEQNFISDTQLTTYLKEEMENSGSITHTWLTAATTCGGQPTSSPMLTHTAQLLFPL